MQIFRILALDKKLFKKIYYYEKLLKSIITSYNNIM